jgi:hypothetical protein
LHPRGNFLGEIWPEVPTSLWQAIRGLILAPD